MIIREYFSFARLRNGVPSFENRLSWVSMIHVSLDPLLAGFFLKNLSLKKNWKQMFIQSKIIIKSVLGCDKLWNSQGSINEVLFLYMCKFDLFT
jgi:hypothetical protein